MARGHHVSSEQRQARKDTDMPQVNVLALVWDDHDLHFDTKTGKEIEPPSSKKCDCSFDREFDGFLGFLKTRLSYSVTRLDIPDDTPAKAVNKAIHSTFAPSSRHCKAGDLSILFFSGHGGVDGNGVWCLASGKGPVVWWPEIEPALRATLVDDVLIIMDACKAGAVANNSRWFELNRGANRSEFELAQCTDKTVGLLAAGDRRSWTPGAGDGTLTTQLGRAITTLLAHDMPLTVNRPAALLGRGVVHPSHGVKLLKGPTTHSPWVHVSWHCHMTEMLLLVRSMLLYTRTVRVSAPEIHDEDPEPWSPSSYFVSAGITIFGVTAAIAYLTCMPM